MTKAGVWIDSSFMKLTDNPTYTISTGLFVADGDIYVCGSTYGANTNVQCWKNGNLVPFEKTDYNGLPQEVYVSGSDVYVCGQVKEETDRAFLAAYWKNGKLAKLEDTRASAATDIKVSGSDIYVAGWARFPRASAMIWVNGVPTRLNDDDYYSYASGISVVGNDIYVSGWSEDSLGTTGRALYWKNGVQYILTSPGVNGVATDVFIDGADIYISGAMYTAEGLYTPLYWKNGIVTTLGNYNTQNAATSIFVKDDDVYVTGRYGEKANHRAVYWKNGNKVELSADTSSYTQSIFVR